MHELPPTDLRNWRKQALIHLDHCVHGSPDFFHWHRHYITQYELICGHLIGNPTFALAYWDWTADTGKIPDPFYDLDFLNVSYWKDPSGAQSPKWGGLVDTIGTRGLSKGEGLQDRDRPGRINFIASFIHDIQGNSRYDLYQRGVEDQAHGTAHGVVGANADGPLNGHMASGMSPLDPIFWLHHCNVDRLWEEWNAAGNTTPPMSQTYQNHFCNVDGKPITANAAGALDATKLGFRYQRSELAVALAPAPRAPAVGAPAPGAARPAAMPAEPVQKQLRESQVVIQERAIGTRSNGATATVGVPTAIPVAATGATSVLLSQRTFRTLNSQGQKHLSAEGGRVLLRLNGVSIDKESGVVLVNVFVNHPDVTAGTPSTDPHFAGAFSMFGHGGHAGHSVGGQDGTTIIVNATKVLIHLLQADRFGNEQISVQLVPIPASRRRRSDARVTVKSIDVLRT